MTSDLGKISVERVFFVLILSIGIFDQTNGGFTKLEFNDCGSTAITLNKIDVTPMPIARPSIGNLTLNVNIKRPISEHRKT